MSYLGFEQTHQRDYCEIMVTDIRARAQRLINGSWEFIPGVTPFDGHCTYGLFGFLADVRNYSAVTPISQPRGLPEGVDPPSEDYDGPLDEWLGEHDYSWLLLSELLSVDYNQTMEDRRFSGMIDGMISGSHTVPAGSGVRMTLRAFLGEAYFEELDRLTHSGVERIVFGFDS
ncbi:hypothetical protein [Sphingomonas colocasiae]|uniref:DUF1851 domain-containing protein n=1 Tax=Sphingomonas colocasiae TaxID=1848973 RepID=A0ABS7PUP8_9SPHN|nr:hypothetical protein [Sphingomonas colocasiae]MBY8825080.1 hypothetical protein [Sphingomonas colocasiae]